MNPHVDILLPCYGTSEKLERTIQSLTQHTRKPYTLSVIVREQSVAMNRNSLLKGSGARYVCFVDDDIELHQDNWLELLLETLTTKQLQSKDGGALKPPSMVGPRVLGPGGVIQNAASMVKEGEIRATYVCGACFLYDRWAFPDVYFDPMYVASQVEDLDFLQMLDHLGGGGSIVDGRVTITHHNEMKGKTSVNVKANDAYYDKKMDGMKQSKELLNP